MSVPPYQHPRLFGLGAIVVLLAVSYLTARTLRWRVRFHHVDWPRVRGRVVALMLGFHLFVMLGSGGVLAAMHGLPATGNLLVIGGILIGVYLSPFLLAIDVLNRLLQLSVGTIDVPSSSNLSLDEVGIAFGAWNLAIYPSIAVLRILLR